jgi:2'-5' RNA ligase
MPNHGTIYWHMLMSSYEEVRAVAQEVQEILSPFPGMLLTPPEWLHMTTLIAGSTIDIDRNQMDSMVSEAQQLLCKIEPVEIIIGRILYHPEAIMLGIEPSDTLLPILDATRSATRNVTGKVGSINGESRSWIPHITVSYSTAEQPAGPIIAALGRSVRPRNILIDSVSLVVQWGPERLWNWEPVGTAHLSARGIN